MSNHSPATPQQGIVIFGATSAIAQACARIWLQRGARLVLVGRHAARLQVVADDLRTRAGATGAAHIHALQADLDPLDGHAVLVDQATALLGSIDIVLIAHGSLPDQRHCEADPALAMGEIHTNGTSVVHLAGLLGRQLAAQGRGSLAVISSVAGDRGRQSNYVYGAAKGLVTLYLQGLRNSLFASGVHVLTIKPGFVDTPMTAAIPKSGPLWATPDQVARGIVRAVDRRQDVAYVPGWWRVIMVIIRAIPEAIFKRLKL
jgi:hypothetical protein